MTGEHSYLDGDNELIAFKDIRKYLVVMFYCIVY